MSKLTKEELRDVFSTPRNDGPGRKGFSWSEPNIFPRGYRLRQTQDQRVPIPVKIRYGTFYPNK